MRGERTELLRAAERSAAEALSLREIALGPVAHLCGLLDAHVGVCYRLAGGGAMSGVMARGPDDILAAYLEHCDDDPLIEAKTRHNPHLAVTTDLVSRDRLRRSRAYRHVYRRADVEHQLVARLTPLEYPHEGVVAAVFARSSRQGRFSEADRAMVGELIPALSLAARRAARLSSLAEERDVLAALAAREGVHAVFGLDGRVRWLSADAERELGDRLARRDPPPELEALLGWLRELVAGGRQGVPRKEARLTLRTGDGPARELEVALSRDGGGWLVALYVAAAELPGAVARAAACYGLRPSEARVLDGLARGRSNADIARELFVSCETVRTHVHFILKKMMARTRLEAVARLRRFT